MNKKKNNGLSRELSTLYLYESPESQLEQLKQKEKRLNYVKKNTNFAMSIVVSTLLVATVLTLVFPPAGLLGIVIPFTLSAISTLCNMSFKAYDIWDNYKREQIKCARSFIEGKQNATTPSKLKLFYRAVRNSFFPERRPEVTKAIQVVNYVSYAVSAFYMVKSLSKPFLELFLGPIYSTVELTATMLKPFIFVPKIESHIKESLNKDTATTFENDKDKKLAKVQNKLSSAVKTKWVSAQVIDKSDPEKKSNITLVQNPKASTVVENSSNSSSLEYIKVKPLNTNNHKNININSSVPVKTTSSPKDNWTVHAPTNLSKQKKLLSSSRRSK